MTLGEMAADRVTGFRGTVTARCEYLDESTSIMLSPSLKADGSYVEPRWFPVDRVVPVVAPIQDEAAPA